MHWRTMFGPGPFPPESAVTVLTAQIGSVDGIAITIRALVGATPGYLVRLGEPAVSW